MNLNKKNKELLMYCALAFVAGYLMCMYYPVHSGNNGYSFSLLEGNDHNAEAPTTTNNTEEESSSPNQRRRNGGR